MLVLALQFSRDEFGRVSRATSASRDQGTGGEVWVAARAGI